MSSRIRSPHQLLSRLGVIAVGMVILAARWFPSAPASADAPDWEPTALTGNVQRLFPTTTDTLYAQVDDDLFRSDDTGGKWSSLNLPSLPPPFRAGSHTVHRIVAVNLANPLMVYTNGEQGVYRSQDGAATWDLALPKASLIWHYFENPAGHASDDVDSLAIAVSPADPRLVYVALTSDQNEFQLVRSTDGGTTWQTVEESTGSICGWIVPILQAHPTDPARLFRTAFCPAHGRVRDSLKESRDQGTTWFLSLDVDQQPYWRWAYIPEQLVGGRGALPKRFYLAANSSPIYGRDDQDGATVFRSDDDAQTWTEILSSGQSVKSPPLRQPQVRIGGLAYDPQQPDIVYVALNNRRSTLSMLELWIGVRVSHDAGANWTDIGKKNIGAVNDLALSPDGRQMYAATDQGVFRIRVAK